MSNIITRQEAAFRLRNAGMKISFALSAARSGDWRAAFDSAYDAREIIGALLDHLDEAADAMTEPAPEPEPVQQRSVGGMGYRGSAGCRAASADTNPPEPITLRPKPLITPPPPPPKPSIPPEAEVVLVNVDRLICGAYGEDERKLMGLIDSFTPAFRKEVLTEQARTHKSVKIWRVEPGEWSILR